MVSSLRTEAMLIRRLFAPSCTPEAPKHANGCHLRALKTRSGILYGDFIKISFCKKCFDEGLAVCVSQGLRNYI